MIMPKLTPRQTRMQDADLVSQCGFADLQAGLPLVWPTPPETAPSPKKQYRSNYRYPGCEKLTDPAVWEYLPLFEILLYLIDFSGLRPVLAQQLGWRTARGQIPFDPVSMFLLLGWQLTNKWNRTETLKKLTNPRYADLVALFGFENGVSPTEGGLRYFLTTLGQNSPCDDEATILDEERGETIVCQRLNEIIAQSVHLLLDAGIISRQAWEKAQICPDGMLHSAASRLRCTHIQAACYEPTTPDKPRPCPAQKKGSKAVPVIHSPAPSPVARPRLAMPRRVLSFIRDATNRPAAPTNQLTRPNRRKAAGVPFTATVLSRSYWLTLTAASAFSWPTIFVRPMNPNRPR